MRRGAKTARAKVKTKLSVVSKSVKDDGSRGRDLEKRLAESLERENAKDHALTEALDTQTATSDILRVISQSQTDVQPVFDAIVASAVRLLGAYSGALTRIAGDQIELAALTSTDAAGDAALRARFPQPLHSEGPHAQAIRDRAPLNIADAQTDPRVPEAVRASARVRGYRSQVVVPLLRHDEAVGAIAVTRREPGGFTDDEIALLKTFADQAVIAIENVRLFNELEGAEPRPDRALEQQTATSEILRVISSSPTDVQPVFDTIVQKRREVVRRALQRALSVRRRADPSRRPAQLHPRSPRGGAPHIPDAPNPGSAGRAGDPRARGRPHTRCRGRSGVPGSRR